MDAASESGSLGGIDALVYAPAIGPLARLVDVDADTWRRAFDTHVIGAAMVTATAIPHLSAAEGIWLQRGLLSGALIDVDDLVDVVHAILRTGATASLPSVTVAPRARKAQR